MPLPSRLIALIALSLLLAGCAPPWAPQNEGIYVVGADGSGLRRLTTDTAEPAWSPDGRRIAFVGEDGLFVVNADGTGRTRLANGSAGTGAPSWSPDGTRIAFVASEERLLSVVAVDESRTTAVPLLDYDPKDELVAFPVDNVPAWSPDGRWLAFVAWDGNGDEVYLVNADGSDRVRLTNVPASEAPVSRSAPWGQKKAMADANNPAWSPDGTRIAFALYPETAGAPAGIFVTSADGSRRARLAGARPVSGPVWSPDGQKIAFAAWRSEELDVFVVKANGWGLTNLTRTHAAAASDPAWSPDGTQIAFVSDGDIWVMNANGTAKKRIAATELEDVAPVWSPDGSAVAFYGYQKVVDV